MGRHDRSSEIRRRRVRRRKLAQLRGRYAAAKTDAERSQVMAKVRRVAPTVTPERFLATPKVSGKTA